jgi:hypothetical protein
MKIIKLFAILFIFTIGCSTSMVGKQMPPAKYAEVSPNSQSIWGEFVIIEIRTEFDKQEKTATAKGVVTLLKTPLGATDFNQIKMKMLLMDKNYTVIREVKWATPSGLHSFAPIPFDKTFPLDPAYRYMHFTGKVSYWH